MTKTLSIAFAIMLASCSNEKIKDEVTSMFRANAAHDGKYKSREIIIPVLKWEFKTGGPITSSATVDNENLYFGSGDSNFYCLDSKKGELKWEYKTGGGIFSTAALFKGTLYFGSYDGLFYALNASDGKVKWTFQTAGEKHFSAPGIHGHLPKDSVFQDDWDFFQSSPAIDNETVYFGTGSGYFYALDASTGKEKWNFKSGGVIHSSPAVGNDKVYFGSWDTYMYALDKNTGKETWKFKTGIDTVIYNQTGMQGSPVLDGNDLYFGCRDAHLYDLNANDGKLVWKHFTDYAWVSSSPVISGDKIIYTTGDTRSLVALNKNNGDSIYTVKSKGWILSSPALVNDAVIYYGDLNGFLYANEVTSGKLVWSYQLESSKRDVYKILSSDSILNYAVIFSNKKREQEKKSSMEMLFELGSIHSSPVVKDGKIYFGSTNGNFYAIQ